MDFDRQKLLQSIVDEHYSAYEDETVIVKQTNDRGRGVFANRDIYPGELLIEVAGEIFREKDYPGSLYCMELKEGYSIEPNTPGCYVNHSCSPNCDLIELTDWSLGFVSAVFIEAGRELTFDYGWKPFEGMPVCRCGSPVCRGWMINRDMIREAVSMAKRAKVDRDQGLPTMRKSPARKHQTPAPPTKAKR